MIGTHSFATDYEISYGFFIGQVEVEPFPAKNPVSSGENYSFQIKKKLGYHNHIITVSVDVEGYDGKIDIDQSTGSCTIRDVQNDLEVKIELIRPTYTVSLTSGDSFSFTPDPLAGIERGDDAVFTINRAFGYEDYFIKVTVDDPGNCGTISVDQQTGKCTIPAIKGDQNVTVLLLPKYVVSLNPGSGFSFDPDPLGPIVQGDDAVFTINKSPGFENHSLEVTVDDPGLCGAISVDQQTGECTIPGIQGDLEVSVVLITSPVYHTVRLTVAPGIWCDYTAGELTVAEGDHFYPQFRTENPSLTAGDILFLVDDVETAFKTSPDGKGGGYILNPVLSDRTILIALREYPVTMPAVDGAVTDPAAGVHPVSYGEPFRFTIGLKDVNDLEDLKVFINDIELTPDPLRTQNAPQQYTIDAVTGPVAIRIEGVNPTGNMEISTNSFNIYVSDGILVAAPPSATRLSVYTVAGQLHTARTIPAGTTRIALPQGVYIVHIGTEVHKVVVN